MRIVAIADIIMSLDNVVAIAAAAKDSVLLLVIGLGISVPLIIAGAALVMTMLTRFPVLVGAGAGLLGWIAGGTLLSEPSSGRRATLTRPGDAHYRGNTTIGSGVFPSSPWTVRPRLRGLEVGGPSLPSRALLVRSCFSIRRDRFVAQ